jgi:coenzyme F420-dependent glucose-6-phosphate dehydrogenase
VNQKPDSLRRIIEAFRHGGGEGKPMCLQVHISYAKHLSEARRLAYEQWYANCFPAPITEALRTPEEFAAAAKNVRPEDVYEVVRVSSDLAQHADWLSADAELGFEAIYVHNVGVNQREFIETFGEGVVRQIVGANCGRAQSEPASVSG